jgi:hypothetical protein
MVDCRKKNDIVGKGIILVGNYCMLMERTEPKQ